MAGSNLNWQQVRVDFNDANSAMRNAQSGLSQAGTVFGQLRKSILDEEQRAIDNAYREQAFNENVRQFGLKHALDRERFGEAIKQFGLTHELNVEEARERARHNAAVEANQAATTRLQQAKFKDEVDQREEYRQAIKNFYKRERDIQKAHDDAVKQHRADQDSFYRQYGLTNDDIKRETDYLAKLKEAYAKNQEATAKLATSQPTTSAPDAAPYGYSPDIMGYNAYDAPVRVPPDMSASSLLTASHAQTPRAIRLNEEANKLATERGILEQNILATEARLQDIGKLRNQYAQDNPKPINSLAIDRISRAEEFAASTGLDPSSLFLGKVALESLGNASNQVIAQQKHEQAKEIANITGEYKLRAAREGKEDKKSDSIGWFKEHKVDERYVGAADLLVSELRTIAKAKNKNIDIDTIRRIVLSTMFDKSSMSGLPGTSIVLKPKGALGSYSDLDGALNFLQTSQGSSKNAVELLEKLGLLE